MTVEPDFKSFSACYADSKPQLVWRILHADLETPVSSMMKLAGDQAYSFLLESVQGGNHRARYSAIGLAPDLIWRCRAGKAEVNRNARNDADSFSPCAQAPLASLKALIEECRIDTPETLPPMAAGLFGYMGYDMVREMETLPDDNPDDLDLADGVFLRPTVMAVFDALDDSVYIITPVWPNTQTGPEDAYRQAQSRLDDVAGRFEAPLAIRHDMTAPQSDPLEPDSNTTREAFHAMVRTAKDYITAGDIFQVVLSQRFSVPLKHHPFALYRSLRRMNPSPFLFYFNFGDYQVIGSSPEILVRLRDNTVTIRPIAGTRKRGKDRAEDLALSEDLLSDPKEKAEHLMLLDLGRNDVGRVAKVGTVNVTDQMTIEYYSHVMHIVSNVEGEIDPRHDSLDALVGGFPAGTVSGAPKVRAMEIIDELENARRGVYAGAVGYFSCDGDMDTCIALRTSVVKDGVMYVQAGAGIVADSDPEAEYQETCNKARALIRAAQEAGRFEGE